MTDGSSSLPPDPSGGKLPKLRRRSRKRDDAMHPLWPTERPLVPAVEGALVVGDRVTLVGEVVVVSTVGSPWIIVRLDGPREHRVACWTDNATQHKGADTQEK